MLKNFEGARLGIFVFLGTALIIVAVFMIGNRESLFISTYTVKTYFTKVEGLKNGAPVRLSGYDIGSVSNLVLKSDTSGQVEVEMRIEERVKHFIRLDSEASIETEGLVGKKIVSISPGTTELAIVQEGGVIKSKDPVNVAEIIEEVQSIMAYLNTITKEFAEVSEKINRGEGTVGKALTDDQLYYATVDVTRSAEKSLNSITDRMETISDFIIQIGENFNGIMLKVDYAVQDVQKMISEIKQGKGLAGSMINDQGVFDSVKTVVANLVKTTQSTMEGASSFAENMEALKHNWLFKNYFEERGYWNKIDYERELDFKIQELTKQNAILEKRIEELKELESKLGIESNENTE